MANDSLGVGEWVNGSRGRWGTGVVRDVRARQQFHRTPRLANVGRGEKTGVWANSPTCHTHKWSYVAHKINLFMPRFVQKALYGDVGVWASWLTSTRVVFNISENKTSTHGLLL